MAASKTEQNIRRERIMSMHHPQDIFPETDDHSKDGSGPNMKLPRGVMMKIIVALLSLATAGGGYIWNLEHDARMEQARRIDANTEETERLKRHAAADDARQAAQDEMLREMRADIKSLLIMQRSHP